MDTNEHATHVTSSPNERLLDDVLRMHDQGLRQRQIALRLGISQATVSTLKSQAQRAGRVPQATPIRGVTAVSAVAVEERVPARSRAEILLEQAQHTADALDAATRGLADHIVSADEWVTDAHYPEGVIRVAGPAVRTALERLERVAEQLGLPHHPAVGGDL